jgi:hypothetical protein
VAVATFSPTTSVIRTASSSRPATAEVADKGGPPARLPGAQPASTATSATASRATGRSGRQGVGVLLTGSREAGAFAGWKFLP